MKNYTINDCGVVTDADTAIEIQGKGWNFRLKTASKDGRFAYGLDYHRKDYGHASPVMFNMINTFATEQEMAKDVIKRLTQGHIYDKRNYPADAVKEITDAIRDKYMQLTLFDL